MAPGGAFMLDLDTPGTYPFASTQFPAMVGTIIVIDVTVTPGPSLTPSVTSSATASATASTTATPGATFTASATSTTTATPTASNTPVTGVKTRNLRVTNVREGGFTVNWTTSLATTGAVRWGLEGTTPANVATDVRGEATASTVHVVDVKGLLPATRYTFDVVSGDGVDANGGAHYPVLTGAALAIPTPDPITGQVLVTGGGPAPLAIVVITIEATDGGATAISTLVQPADGGTWAANLSSLRNVARTASYAYAATSTFTIEAFGGEAGFAKASTTVATARTSAPPLTLAPTSTVSLPLIASWNLVTLPLDPIDPITSVGLCSTLTGAVEIDRWDGGWDVHPCAITGNNFAIETGRGYFIRLGTPRTWTIEGTLPGSRLSFALQSGWNLIGFPGTAARLTAPSLASSIAIAGGASIASDVVREIDRWEASQWEAHVVGLPPNQFPLAEGRGYFVRANRPVTWTNPGLTGTNRVVARDLATVPEEVPPPDQ